MATQPASPLADCRHAAGYTQESFAEKVGVDRTTVGRWERGVQSPQPWQRPDLAAALNTTLDHLDELLRRTKRLPDKVTAITPLGSALFEVPRLRLSVGHEAEFAHLDGRDPLEAGLGSLGDDAVHAAVPRLRRALDSIDVPDDGPTRSLTELAVDVTKMIEHRVQARYVPLAWRLPGLITELARATSDRSDHDSREAATLLTLAFRAADGVAFKFGYLDLSARIIDLMRSSAMAAEDPLLVAAVAYVRTETFFATGDLGTASRLLDSAADQLSTNFTASAPMAAAYGALHMRAVVVAGRARNPDAAWDHLAESQRAANHVHEGIYLGTAFGPYSVRIHELAVAAELGDTPARVERALAWHPHAGLPAERRSHYYIDLARALVDLGRHEDAYLCLEGARTHTRAISHHPREQQVFATVS
jgi:transcriptional regulator with XRE-family HTH domain